MVTAVPEGHSFALCLTHDVDRVDKTFQSAYYAVTERSAYHLGSLRSDERPYWQFGAIRRLESELGVRSAFYFLDEQRLSERPPTEWLSPRAWRLFGGRYDVTEPRIRSEIRRLDAGGWEVGLHGSYESYADRERLREEKARLERVLGHPVRGGRQHYLNLDGAETWDHHAAVGLDYDSSLGSSETYGFVHGYEPVYPRDDGFVVFPLTLMDVALERRHDTFRERWAACEALLDEAADNGAVMTVLWHPRMFNPREFPGFRALYRRLVAGALERDAWVGPPVELYDSLREPEAAPTATPEGTIRDDSPRHRRDGD